MGMNDKAATGKAGRSISLKEKKRDFFPLPQIKEDKAFNEP